jgi:ADP-dependent NAD(P)H-hydrate dehydratase
MNAASIAVTMPTAPPSVETVTQPPVLPSRPADGNKGSFGRVLVVGGSRGMSGAAVLAASAALRGGAGLVRLAVPAELLPIVAAANPCYLTAPLPQDDEGKLSLLAEQAILALAEANDVVALGPGLGRSQSLSTLIPALLARIKVPVVLDADGLNALENQLSCLKSRQAPLILTPHPGEFARLLGSTAALVQANRKEWAAQFARDYSVALVLKGRGTVVTEGRRLYVNTTGNPGMATGGTGRATSSPG